MAKAPRLGGFALWVSVGWFGWLVGRLVGVVSLVGLRVCCLPFAWNQREKDATRNHRRFSRHPETSLNLHFKKMQEAIKLKKKNTRTVGKKWVCCWGRCVLHMFSLWSLLPQLGQSLSLWAFGGIPVTHEDLTPCSYPESQRSHGTCFKLL